MDLQSQLEEAILERKAAQGREAYMRHDLEAKQFVVRDMHEAFCSIVDARQRQDPPLCVHLAYTTYACSLAIDILWEWDIADP